MDGVVIADIDEGSAAGRVGFRKGDLILAINGERVNTSKDLERILRGGSQLWRITINRGGQVITSVLGG
jgi:S1-C subfamily serine protease